MTTIAFKDGIMASDSQCTDDYNAFLTKCRKIDRLPNGALIGQAGDADARELIALLGKATPRKLPSRKELGETKTKFHGILAFPNGRVFMVSNESSGEGSDGGWRGEVVEIEERMCAVGSGYQFALGAMAAGKSARQAVEVACRYDVYSRTPAREMHVIPVKK